MDRTSLVYSMVCQWVLCEPDFRGKVDFEMQIQPYDDSQLDAIVRLSLRAWEPVFDSIENAMDRDVYREFYPDGWHVAQGEAVASVCTDPGYHVWVALEGSETVGFAALKLHAEDRMGEIYMIAVDPDFQRQGIAAALTNHSLGWFKDAGMSIAMVETGGDPGHAPARRTYESTGFRLLPIARYFKKLQDRSLSSGGTERTTSHRRG